MNNRKKILVIDDEQGIRDLLAFALGTQDYNVITAANGREGIEKVKGEGCDLVILDLKMPKLGGIETLQEIKKIDSGIEVIVATGFGTIETAINAMKNGAYDFIAKPFNMEELSILLQKAIERKELKVENALYKASKVIFSSLDQREIVNRIIGLILKIIKTDDASIMLFNSVNRLYIAASYKLDEEVKRKTRLRMGEHIVEKMAQSREPLIINPEPGHEYSLDDIPADEGIKSIMACPLPAKNGILGLITLYRISMSGCFGEIDLQTISIFSAQIAQAIENANLYKELEIKIQKLKETEKILEYGATHDPLTNLPNRALMHDRVSRAISRAQRGKTLFSLLLLDLDGFKEINDTLGHETGDLLLKKVSAEIQKCLRECDTLARMGGDEFVLVFNDLKNTMDAEIMASRILNVFKPPFLIQNHEINITPSIGIAIYPDNGDNIEILLKNADLAMYEAKKLGGNRFNYFTPTMGAAVRERMIVRENLQNAISKNEFIIYYQPLNETDSGKLTGAEALIRWQHPQHGMIEPLNFIAIAESTGLIRPLGEWVLRTACAQGKKWQEQGYNKINIAVNISNIQLREKDITGKIKTIVSESGYPPENLILEITETSAMSNIEHNILILKELSEFGVKIYIDDFGTSYSSLNWLKKLPIHGLKIDRFFIQNISEDSFNAAIVKTIIVMAHSLNLKVIAEGVETPGQLEFLKTARWSFEEKLQCDQVQGFLFSKPVTAEKFSVLLEKKK